MEVEKNKTQPRPHSPILSPQARAVRPLYHPTLLSPPLHLPCPCMSPPVPLGREVRDWVLVPLTLTLGLMMVMRQYATVSVGNGARAAAPFFFLCTRVSGLSTLRCGVGSRFTGCSRGAWVCARARASRESASAADAYLFSLRARAARALGTLATCVCVETRCQMHARPRGP